MTASPALQLYRLHLADAIALACRRDTPVAVHRRARREAVALARRCVREAVAAQWREDLSASVPLTTFQRDGCWYDTRDTGSRWTGD